MQFLLLSAISCTLLGLIEVEFISGEILKKKIHEVYFWRERGEQCGLARSASMAVKPCLTLKDIDGILTDRSSFQWKELLLLN